MANLTEQVRVIHGKLDEIQRDARAVAAQRDTAWTQIRELIAERDTALRRAELAERMVATRDEMLDGMANHKSQLRERLASAERERDALRECAVCCWCNEQFVSFEAATAHERLCAKSQTLVALRNAEKRADAAERELAKCLGDAMAYRDVLKDCGIEDGHVMATIRTLRKDLTASESRCQTAAQEGFVDGAAWYAKWGAPLSSAQVQMVRAQARQEVARIEYPAIASSPVEGTRTPDDTMGSVGFIAHCVCGHPQTGHVYHEGACRTGVVCASGCEKFRPAVSQEPPRRVTIQGVEFWYEPLVRGGVWKAVGDEDGQSSGDLLSLLKYYKSTPTADEYAALLALRERGTGNA